MKMVLTDSTNLLRCSYISKNDKLTYFTFNEKNHGAFYYNNNQAWLTH